MRCRRCHYSRLLRLDKKCSQDNDVYRCQECGFLFSPPAGPGATTEQEPDTSTGDGALGTSSLYGPGRQEGQKSDV